MMQPDFNYLDQFKKHLQKIIDVNDEQFEQVVTYFTVQHIPRKSWLLRHQQVSRVESFIVNGVFQTSVIDDTGRTTILYFPHEDWWVGDFKSFETETASQMEIYALEDSVVLQISRDNLKKLFIAHPVFERFFRILNGNMAIALQDRLLHHLSANAENQYREFNERFPRLHNRLSNKRIAGFLGITPEYFSQMLKRYKS
jgi:CRP-like cAMP-binding protein